MNGSFRRADEGQALVVVALAMVVLMGGLGLTLDWGRGYVLRRGMQNTVDAATLAAGRHVASTYQIVSGGPGFGVTQEDICEEVRGRVAAPATAQVSFFSDPNDELSWTTISTSNCASGAGDLVPPDTLYVRIRATTTYKSLFDIATRQPMAVATSARVRLTAGATVRPLLLPPGASEEPGVGISGSTTAPNVAIWPIALHYEASDYSGTPCGQYCDTSRRSPMTFFGSGADRAFGSFRGLVTLTHDSLRQPWTHQLLTESDYRGSAEGDQGHPVVPPYPNASDQTICGGATWDTKGAESQTDARNCDLPNWFYYGFGGSIGVGTDWSDTSWDAYRGSADLPNALPTSRASCDAPAYFNVRSCPGSSGSSQVGDWVETITSGGGDLTLNMANRMLEFIDRYGRVTPASAGGLGKAVVVYVLLWDCADHYNGTSWSLLEPRGGFDEEDGPDCSQIRWRDSRSTSVDRVHVFAAVPFTFYEGLIDTGRNPIRVRAYWGNAFGDAGSCAADPLASGCGLNPLMNSAFLVPDD